MKKTAIVTDTNSGISPAEAASLGIRVVPMPIIIDGEANFEGVTCTYKEFFDKLSGGAEVNTSQPSVADLTELWEEVLETHETLVYIPMSSGLSGACNTAKALAGEYEGRVFVADNKRISVTQKQSVLDAIKLADYGLTAKEICDVLEREALEASIYITVNTLDLLKKSGRVTKAAAAVAAVLNIKPVLTIQGEKLDAFKKARGLEKAKSTMIDALRADLETRFKGQNVTLATAWSGDDEQGLLWTEECKEAFPGYDFLSAPLPLSICCHVAEGAVGIGVIKRL